jgi:hypothetical protein
MEDVSDILAPMQKQFVKYFVDDELIEVLLELLRKDIVKLIDNGQYLLKEV